METIQKEEKQIETNADFETKQYRNRRLELNNLEKKLKTEGLLKDDERILQWRDTHPLPWTTQYRELTIFLVIFGGLIFTFIEDRVGFDKLAGMIFWSFIIALGTVVLWGFLKKLRK